MEEITAHFQAKDGKLVMTLQGKGMIVHFDYSREAVQSVETMMVGMKAIHSVISVFSGEEEADRAMRELSKRLEPPQN